MFSSTSAGSSRGQNQTTSQTTRTDPSPPENYQHRRLSNPSLDETNNYNNQNRRRTNSQHHRPTILEPPFSYADHRPSSPRHHSTSRLSNPSPRRTPTIKPPTPGPSAATRATLQLPDDNIPTIWPEDDEGHDGHDDIVLPRLRPPVESLANVVGWPMDVLDHFYTSSDGTHNQLSDFANQDFSSPSTYPSLTNTSHMPPRDIETSPAFVHPHSTSRYPESHMHNREPPYSASASTSNLSNSSTHTSTTTTSDSQFSASASAAYLDTLDTLPDSDTMPPSTRRSSLRLAETIVLDADQHANKRQRTTEQSRGLKKEIRSQTRHKPTARDDPFADLEEGGMDSAKREDGEEPLMIDLTETPAAAKDVKPPCEPEEDNRTKLGAFQCVICMDNVTNLTLTHCGTFFLRPVCKRPCLSGCIRNCFYHG